MNKRNKAPHAPETPVLYEVSLTGKQLFYVYQVLLGAPAAQEQEIRDKAYILRQITEEGYAKSFSEIEEDYFTLLDKIAEDNKDKSARVPRKQELAREEFWNSLNDLEPHRLILKVRQLKYLDRSLKRDADEGGPQWQRELCHVAVEIFDAVAAAVEYEEEVDTNEDMPAIPAEEVD